MIDKDYVWYVEKRNGKELMRILLMDITNVRS